MKVCTKFKRNLYSKLCASDNTYVNKRIYIVSHRKTCSFARFRVKKDLKNVRSASQ